MNNQTAERMNDLIDELCELGDKLGDWVLMVDRKHADSSHDPAFWRETVFRWRWK